MITLSSLMQLEQEGLITLRPNKDNNLFIANYTPQVQYGRLWTDLLLKCRGLIIDTQNQIIARPLPKFFNLEEHAKDELPLEEFEVYEKLDGSLGISYYDKGWKIASRGSFYSEQAEKATYLLHSKYSAVLHLLDRDKTYLFEIIYPANKIVVDYGDRESLVLLAIIDTKTGAEQSIDDFPFPEKVKRYEGINDLNTIRMFENKEEEGFVIKFESGFRVKVKFTEYLKLHKLFTQVTSKTIWEYLMHQKNFDELLEKTPDEFYTWIKTVKQNIEKEHENVLLEVRSNFKNAPDFASRKDFAQWAQTQKYPNLLFSLLDGKRIEEKAWKLVEPDYERP